MDRNLMKTNRPIYIKHMGFHIHRHTYCPRRQTNIVPIQGDQCRLDLDYRTNQHHDPPSLLWHRVRDKDWIFITWLL